MFETVLDADTLAGWQQTLAHALAPDADSSFEGGLDDAARVDALRALEELVCTATAAQAKLAADLDVSQRRVQAAQGVPAVRRGRGVAAQVGLARRESHHRGQRHLGLAKVVTTELPHTWAAWRTGRITEWTATLIARETACLTREDRMTVVRPWPVTPRCWRRWGFGRWSRPVRPRPPGSTSNPCSSAAAARRPIGTSACARHPMR